MTNTHVFLMVAGALSLGTSAVAQDRDSAAPLAASTVGVMDAVTSRSAPLLSAAQNTVPPVEHTGLETLVTDIINDFKAFPQRESTWVILAVGGATALAVHPADNAEFHASRIVDHTDPRARCSRTSASVR